MIGRRSCLVAVEAFEHVGTVKRADLDVLHRTQGYRRFEWKALLAGTLPPNRIQNNK